ncbi:MAG: STELLO glycosyltransferase family protein, partial [Verrucomicrobiae bacterium]|nr:STELLO glycosyltransferase family protein [Verrucomicrobiae bacterium]
MIAVLTTIQPPTASVRSLVGTLARVSASLIVVGDKKGPATFDLPGTEFFPLPTQYDLPYRLAKLLPIGHYSRKNLGYLIAISRRAPLIYETDDDNAPNDRWQVRALSTRAQKIAARPWANVYRLFTDELIWPRGFPLDLVRDPTTFVHDRATAAEAVEAPIQQGLADLAPDVDAIWRLLLDREFYFPPDQQSVWLPPGTWCPFNSQTTWWWPIAYPLMYLPSHCSFRMTDIWRSFVAQRCLWELGYGLVFHSPEAIQQRNLHNLLRDFEDELPGYRHNHRITEILSNLSLSPGAGNVAHNLVRCYEALVTH